MKNILIITTTRDDMGSQISFIKDICEITEPDLREMIERSINNENWESDDLWTNDGDCGSDRGYIFNDYNLLDNNLPIQVDFIVNHCC